MKLKSISTILRAGALAALFVVGTSVAANAATLVQWTTTGDFGGGSSFVVFGPDGNGDTATLTYTGNPGGNVTVPTGFEGVPINSNFGNFDLDFNGPNDIFFAPGGVNQPFTLTIHQTSPTGGNGNFLGTINGSIVSANASTLELVWSTPQVTIGGVVYRLDNVSINNPGNNNGITSVQGDLTVAVPEPATMMLLGTGLLAAFRARRKSA